MVSPRGQFASLFDFAKLRILVSGRTHQQCRCMPRTEVVFYRDDDGTIPVLDWIDGLPLKARLKCLMRLARLRELGHALRRPEADFLRDGIHELRISLNHVQYRLLYGFSITAERDVSDEAGLAGPTKAERKSHATKGSGTAAKARRSVAVVAHGITKEKCVPDEEIDRAVIRMKKFTKNPKAHTFTEG